MTKSPVTCWNARRFIGVTVRGQRVRRSTRQCCRGVERIRVSRRAATFFPLAASYRFCGDYGAWQGSKWSSARPEAGGEGNKKRGRELLEKRRGTSASLYLVKDRAGR